MNRARQNRPSIRPGPARWTPLELLMIVVSVMMIAFPLLAETTRWVSPPNAPAANRQDVVLQRVTETSVGDLTATPVDATATSTPESTATTSAGGTATSTPEPTATTPADATATSTPDITATPGDATATNTPESTTPPDSTAITAPTNTPLPNDSRLIVAKSASASIVRPGEEFVFTITALTSSTTAEPVRIDDTLASQFEAVSAQSSSGTCTVGQTISCNLNVTNSGVIIRVRVRVRTTASPGTQISNEALGQITGGTNSGFNAASETVFVVIEGSAITPTATSPSDPTTAPGQPTATSTSPTNPTPAPGQPTVTSAPQPTPSGGGGGGGGGSNPEQPPIPTNPPLPPLPPVAQPGASPTVGAVPRPSATVRPRANATSGAATARPGSQAGATAQATLVVATLLPTSTPTSAIPTPDSGLYFRMASDWGSAYPEQTVNYVIAVRNNRAAGAANYTNLQISSELPNNLQVVSARADRGGDPIVTGNRVALRLDALAPNQGVEIVIQTKVRPGVSAGTSIVSQAALSADGLPLQSFSNNVSLLVVGAPPLQRTAVPTSGPTSAPTAVVASPSVVPAATAPATATRSAATQAATTAPAATSSAATPRPTATIVAGGSGGAPTLPNTSTGVPLFGLALLGMTMMLRTVRIHRSQTRL